MPSWVISLLPLVGVIIGGLVSALTSFFLNSRTNKQQLMRDKEAHKQQLEREQIAYVRSLKDAKRERLRKAYKMILNGAEEYYYAVTRMSTATYTEPEEVEEALVEIALEDISRDVKSTFIEVRGLCHDYSVKIKSGGSPGTFNPEEERKAMESKIADLGAAMRRSLSDTEV